MDIQELMSNGSNVQFVINGEDLMSFAEALIGKRDEQEQPQRPTTYSTDTMDAKEVCEMLHVGLATLWRYRKQGRIKEHKIGSRLLFSRSEIEDSLCGGKLIKYGREA